MWCLPAFGVDELESCGKRLRALADADGTMEGTATRLVGCLHDGLVDQAGHRATTLVRFYKTHRFGGLDADLQDVARSAAAGERLDRATPCLVLLGTTGDEPAWCDRRRSRHHQAIPLTSAEAVARLPMVSRLFHDLGVDVADVREPSPAEALALHHRTYGLFFVPEAGGSASVPDQDDFVVPYGVRSVLGIGGALPSGDMFALVVFATVPVTEAAADVFRSLALAVKAAVIPVTYRVFVD